MVAILRLLEDKGATPNRCERILSSGFLADLFDADADLSDRVVYRNSLKLSTAAGKRVSKVPPLLSPNGHAASVVLTARHDPDAFYQTRNDLYVDGFFRSRIVATAKPTEVGMKFKKLPRFLLSRNATGKDLKSARPKAIFTATEFCPWLAAKIAQQPKGEVGDLAIDQWNLFLVEGLRGGVFLVDVDWYVDCQRWCVGMWDLTDGWNAGCQFFSRN